MAQITAAMVKELRDRSMAGMADCKKALEETSGDMEKAADWLRKGITKAGQAPNPRRHRGRDSVVHPPRGKIGVLLKSTARPTSWPAPTTLNFCKEHLDAHRWPRSLPAVRLG